MYHTKTVKGGCYIRPVLFCGDISSQIEHTLIALGYRVFRLPPSDALPEPVRHHPDMLMAELPSGKLLLSRDYYEKNEAVLSPFARHLEPCDETLGNAYPSDVKFNALPIGNTLFCGRTVAKALAAHYDGVVTVRQGYTHCACARLGKGIVTADLSLYQALLAQKVDALLISSGGVALSPYDTGFIGGASITLSDTLTGFFGKLEAHPDYGKILAFARQMNCELLSLSNEPLTDFGGGYLLYDEAT